MNWLAPVLQRLPGCLGAASSAPASFQNEVNHISSKNAAFNVPPNTVLVREGQIEVINMENKELDEKITAT